MKPYDLFNLICNSSYTKSGDDVDWTIIIDNDEKTIRLLFQESASKRDWLNNFNFPKKLYKYQENNLWIARGWGNAYKSCNDEIMASLIEAAYQYDNYKIEISGWSYGGALAQIAIEDFYYRTKFKADLVTFGSPKPLWGKKSVETVKKCCTSIKNYTVINDIVPYMPPFPGYKLLNKIKLGESFNFFKIFNPWKYHTSYGDKTLYSEGN